MAGKRDQDPDPRERLGCFPFVIGGMAFIPLVGVPFGVAAIVWGFVTRRAGGRKLALVGALGIFFTITLYSGLFYFGFVQRGGIYDDLRRQLAQTTINDLVAAIELYKTQRGNYPANLSELRGSLAPNSFVSIGDPSRLFLPTASLPCSITS